ncbi:hypothetical protein CKO28_25790 [Rhodovibrio sodomensis]|uniref:Uncharacterized protein n=1 Tax=Rhodovibrio sodomensis TaxID=1088 RepID=A0ABS1DMU4_9PROT|nr:hypothetical protein [Rhodovibrio sodomensis]MBK1671417.1 hypothetical protein [Rhodovibrio sodomensis]
MSNVGPLNVTSNNAAEFRATGENAHVRRWLSEVRSDMTSDACRQVTFYARKLLDILGAETGALVQGPPLQIQARLSHVDLPAHGLSEESRRHLLRAGAALHAAIYDLDTENARRVMDRRTPQRRPSTGGRRPVGDDPLPSGDLLAGIADGRVDAPAQQAATAPVPVDPRNLSESVRPLVEAVNHAVTAQLRLDDDVDVRAVTRAALTPLSARACLQVAVELPHAAALPVPIPAGRAAPTPAEVAAQAIVAVVEQRFADLRPA